MREMKKTTIPFCEYIPDKWQVLQNRYLFCNHSVKVGENYNEYQLLSLTTSGVKKKDINASGGKVPTSYYNYQTVSNGDMIFCLFDLDCSAVFSGLSSFEGMITSAYDVFKPEEKYVDKHYIEYWFQYVFSYRYYKMYSKSIRYTITSDMFKAITTPVPPIEEQRRIGEYLDSKCTQIDALISNAQQQIEKLKAYKQSVITETVTKGLDPDVQMKDSGVEWIGEIPEHWTVAPIRSFFKIKKDIIGHEPDAVLSITQGGIKVKDINENSGQMANSYAHYQIVNIGDFAMNHMDLLTGGVGISEFEGVTSPDYRVFVMRNADMNPRYFLYVFQMYYRNKIFYAFGQGAANLGRWRLPAQNFNTVAVPLSPVEEQNNIVTFLDEKCSQIDKLIALKQQKIEKLQQYKKSLIYEYVTGKKEV